jgi:hypothetical protein
MYIEILNKKALITIRLNSWAEWEVQKDFSNKFSESHTELTLKLLPIC